MSSEAPKHIWCCSRCSAIYRKDFPFCPADGAEVVSMESDPLIGAPLDHYTIDALIGEGAMGRVYRAHHTQLTDRIYAVKVLIGDLAATQEARMRFVNEAKSASRLSHPNVVSVIDVGRSAKGLLYLVMELVDGTPLSDLIVNGPMDPMRTARLIRGVCHGLGHAHDRGLVHRDLKPENIIVVQGPDGEVPRIVDFGIALVVDRDPDQARLTETGMALGTAAYIAPEQVCDEQIDGRADQYSVGVTMFEMLSGGALPFNGTSPEVVNAKARNDAPSLEDAMPADAFAPPGLVRMVERMLSRKPSDRYASIHDIARMLTRYIDAPQTVILDERRPRRGYYYAAAIAAVMLGGGALAWNLRDRAPADAATPVAAKPDRVEPDRIDPDRVEPDRVEPDRIEPDHIEIEPSTTPTRTSIDRRGTRTRTQRARKVKPTKPAPVAVSVAPPPDAPEVPALVEPTPRPPPPPSPLPARIDSVRVSGAVSHADVERALGRVSGALRRCTAPGAQVARIQFAIDDSRRARDIRVSGAPNTTLACLTSAIGGLRTEAAPDVGAADVVVQIGFR